MVMFQINVETGEVVTIEEEATGTTTVLVIVVVTNADDFLLSFYRLCRNE